MVRRSSREFEKDEIFDKEKCGNVEIEARLTTSIETILRYTTRLKRDLYKAIRVLGDLQDRRARVSTPAVSLRKKLER